MAEPWDDAAMSFVEIAKALGYRDPEDRGKKAVWMAYRSGMNKLKQRPTALRKLLELSRELRLAREQREAGDVE